jgi:protein SCO1/2
VSAAARALLPLALLAAVVGVVWWRAAPALAPATAQPTPTWPPFTLLTADGPRDLSDERGHAVIVYFGYTACPDICPTTLATAANALARLPEDARSRARLWFITVDPERDTLPRLADYARWFQPDAVGGQLAPADLLPVTAAWGVGFRKVELEGSAMGYAVDHSTDAYLVGPDGRFVRTLPHGMTPDAMARAVLETLGSAP